MKEAEVRVPTDMIAIGDGFFLGSTIGFASGGGASQNGATVFAGASLLQRSAQIIDPSGTHLANHAKAAEVRHRGRANILFCDGHVSLLRNESLFLDQSDATMQRWNRDHQRHR